MGFDTVVGFKILTHYGKLSFKNNRSRRESSSLPDLGIKEVGDQHHQKTRQKRVFSGTLSVFLSFFIFVGSQPGISHGFAIHGDEKAIEASRDALPAVKSLLSRVGNVDLFVKNEQTSRNRLVEFATAPGENKESSVNGFNLLLAEVTNDKALNEEDKKWENNTANQPALTQRADIVSLPPKAQSALDLQASKTVADENENTSLKEVVSTREIKLQDTSDLHIDSHNNDDNDDGSQFEENIKNVPSSDFVKKVVVLQKPFHFHIPILSQNTLSKTSEHAVQPQGLLADGATVRSNKMGSRNKIGHSPRDAPVVTITNVLLNREKDEGKSSADHVLQNDVGIDVTTTGVLTKRNLEAQVAQKIVDYPFFNLSSEAKHLQSQASMAEHLSRDRVGNEYLDHLLNQHPQLVPSVNRKRSSGKRQDNWSVDEEIHHLIGKLPLEDDDDVMMGHRNSQTIIGKRNVKKMRFSQDLVGSILGHKDDLDNYKKRIMAKSKALGISPVKVFESVVYGPSPTNTEKASLSTPKDIYQRRLQFHELFLDDSAEVVKYQYNEVLHEDNRAGWKSVPYSAYMKILKRSKRGLKSWLKKLFKKGEGKPASTTKRPVAKKIPTDNIHKNHKNEQKKIGKAKKDYVVFKQVVDVNGDSQVDYLLPLALRRSTYLKKLEQVKYLEVEEKNFELEYEKSEEKEPTSREKASSSASDEQQEVDRDQQRKTKNDKVEKSEENESKKKKRKEGHITKHTSNGLHTPRIKRDVGGGATSERMQIFVMSKDEISLVMEMLFNVIEYQCPNVNPQLMEGLLTITQTTVSMSSLLDYIPKRRRTVDELFSQMLECSSNTENMSRWSYSQLRRREQKPLRSDGNAQRSVKGTWDIKLVEMPLRRSKRVRRELTSRIREVTPPTIAKKALELITLNTSLPGAEKINKLEETEKKDIIRISKDNNNDYDKTTRLKKLYVLVYQIIADTCFKMDIKLLHDSSVVFLEEMTKLQSKENYQGEVENFLENFDIGLANKALTECYAAEL